MAHLKEQEGWERSDFPILCESCLGDNPYVRMTRAEFDKECKICQRPFTVFRWRPGKDARYKKTEVCQTCAKVKNVCQTCLLDLEFGLPVQVRDTALPSVDPIPQSDANREYFSQVADQQIANGQISYGKFEPSAMIQKLARTTPYYKRNRAHVCSFFVKGECKRGNECPYRHEMPETGELSVQNIKDRYYGVNDPVAKKLLRKADTFAKITPPEDKDITTLYVGGVDPTKITEEDIRGAFYSYGELRGVKLSPVQKCAFVSYTTRAGAEAAAEKLFGRCVVNGCNLRIAWGKPASAQSYNSTMSAPDQSTFFSLPIAPTNIAPLTADTTSNLPLNFTFPAAGMSVPNLAPRMRYPSMDPNQYGAPADRT